ncbi:MAG: YceI family protein [Chloroflexota bacterium]
MKRISLSLFPILFLFLGCSQQVIEPTLAAPASEPTPIVYPENATVFVVDRTDSGARYRITETFFEEVSKEAQNIEPGTIQAIGNAPSLEGTIVLDLESDPPRVLGGEFVVDLFLMRTDQPRRDERLRSQWLQVYTYPTASFVLEEQDILSSAYEPGTEATFSLTGQMTIRNVTLPLTFETTAVLDPSLQTITATANAPALISDFGIEPPSLAKIVEVEDAFEIGAIIVARATE